MEGREKEESEKRRVERKGGLKSHESEREIGREGSRGEEEGIEE